MFKVSNLKGRLTMLALSATMLLGLLAATPTPVQGATVWSTLNHDAITHFCVRKDSSEKWLPGCVAQKTLNKGAEVAMKCWYKDAWATGNYKSDKWFYVVSAGGTQGFIHSSWIDYDEQWHDSPWCSGSSTSVRGIRAARLAAMKVGNTKLSSTDRSVSSVQPAPTYWSGWCYLFTYIMHEETHGYGPKTGTGSAYGAYTYYKNKGSIRTDWDSLNIGSIIFYGTSSPGHAALFVGQGKVVTTQGTRESDKKEIAIKSISSASVSAKKGWVSPGSF